MSNINACQNQRVKNGGRVERQSMSTGVNPHTGRR